MPSVHSEVLDVYTAVGGSQSLEGVLSAWNERGWEVRRHYTVSEEQYRRAGGQLRRIQLRWQMYVQFGWQCWQTVRQARGNAPLRVVTSNPFYGPALAQWAAQGFGTTVNLVYDLYPDALVQAEVLREDSWLAHRVASITKAALRGCDATVFLGERLRRHAEARYGAARRSVVIPVGADGSPFRDTPPRLVGPQQDIKILYAGQLGRMHEVETLQMALRAGVPAGLQLAFHAIGTGYERLRGEDFPGARCLWGEPLPQLAWENVMMEAQVALVTMAPGAENIVMPSKTYSALVAGQAVLAICSAQSDLADLVRKHDCGWVIAPGDVAGLRICLDEITRDQPGLLAKRLNAFNAGHTYYDVAVLAKQWMQLFDSLTAD